MFKKFTYYLLRGLAFQELSHLHIFRVACHSFLSSTIFRRSANLKKQCLHVANKSFQSKLITSWTSMTNFDVWPNKKRKEKSKMKTTYFFINICNCRQIYTDLGYMHRKNKSCKSGTILHQTKDIQTISLQNLQKLVTNLEHKVGMKIKKKKRKEHNVDH